MENPFQRPFRVIQSASNVLAIVDRNGKEICEVSNANNEGLRNEDHFAAGLIETSLNAVRESE